MSSTATSFKIKLSSFDFSKDERIQMLFDYLRVFSRITLPFEISDILHYESDYSGHCIYLKDGRKYNISFSDFDDYCGRCNDFDADYYTPIWHLYDLSGYWTTKDGTTMLISEMTDNHFINAHNFCHQRIMNLKANLILLKKKMKNSIVRELTNPDQYPAEGYGECESSDDSFGYCLSESAYNNKSIAIDNNESIAMKEFLLSETIRILIFNILSLRRDPRYVPFKRFMRESVFLE